MNKPLVSIVTPTFNSASFLKATIESVVSQTFTDWELLIVDDASSDSTTDISGYFASLDSRIRTLNLASNRGAAEARNMGIDSAKGRYIAFIDSDDLWLPDKLTLEKGFSADTIRLLEQKGHRIDASRWAMGSTQSILKTEDGWTGASDPRQADTLTDGY